MARQGTAPLISGARVGVAALMLLVLAGCSSVPDAMNPVEWYRSTRDAIAGNGDADKSADQGDSSGRLAAERGSAPPGADQPIPNLASVPPRPQTSSSTERQRLASGLIADQQSARKYSGETIPRQNATPQPPPPARPQAAPAPAPSQPSSARSGPPASPPPPPAAASPPPPPVTSSPAPPAVAPAPPPPPAVAPPPPPTQEAAVPPPGAARTPPQLREVTPPIIKPGSAQPIQPSNIVIPSENPQAPQLAEVKPYVPPPGIDAPGTVFIGGGGQSVAAGPATPTAFRAVPPPGTVAAEVPGTRPLSSFSAAGTRGSYQVATIQFANGSARLSDKDRAILRDVVEQHRRMGGTLRVVGHASSRTGASSVERHRLANMRVSAERAEAVARELARQGVPPNVMYVGAVSDADPRYYEFMPTGEAGNRRAEIFIDF